MRGTDENKIVCQGNNFGGNSKNGSGVGSGIGGNSSLRRLNRAIPIKAMIKQRYLFIEAGFRRKK